MLVKLRNIKFFLINASYANSARSMKIKLTSIYLTFVWRTFYLRAAVLLV